MPHPQSSSILDLSTQIYNNIKNGAVNSGFIPTEFKFFDDEFGGLILGELVVVGGRTAMGKSLFAVSLVSNICEKQSVLFFSFDLSPTVLGARLLSCRAKIPVSNILHNSLSLKEKKQLETAIDSVQNSKLLVTDIGAGGGNEIVQIITEHVATHQTKVVVIDYLQLIGTRKFENGREAEIAHICRVLKTCARDLNIAVILLSQLSRAVELRGCSKKPKLFDLRDSGSIEQLADKVLLLYRPEYYCIEFLDSSNEIPAYGVLELIVAKNKNGKVGSSYFERDANFTSFNSVNNYELQFDIDKQRLDSLIPPNTFNNDNTMPF